MNKFIAVSLFFLSFAASATHLEKVCQEALIADENRPGYAYSNPPSFAQNLISRRDVITGEWVIENDEGKKITNLQVPIRRLVKTDESIWVLAPFDLIEIGHDGEIRDTYNFEPSMNRNWGALDMVKVGDMVVISRGIAGLLAFDLKTKKVIWVNVLKEGHVAGLTLNENIIYAAVASSKESGFTGILSFKSQSGEILARSPYQIGYGVVDIDAKAHMLKENLVLNNGGWIHVLSLAQINSGKPLRPKWVAHIIPRQGDVNEHYMMINGDFFFDSGEIVACGNYVTKIDGEFTRKSRLFKVKMP